MIDSVVGIKKEINKIRKFENSKFWSVLGSQEWFRIGCSSNGFE